MPPVNLRRIDLNLLTIFEAVYEEGSQQKAAERLYMTQPAVSSAITRLRHLVNDRLFTGTRNIRPTVKADELYGQIKLSLDIIRHELVDKQDFDPATTSRTFTIAITYGGGYLFATPIYRKMKEVAPFAKLCIRSVDPWEEVPTLLRQQDIDLACSSREFGDAMLAYEFCFDYMIVGVVRQGHPRIEQDPSIDELLRESFIWVHGTSLMSEVRELQDLAKAAEARIEIEVPNILVAPDVLVQTDLVALMPWAMAKKMQESHPVSLFNLPFPQLPHSSKIVWHRAYGNDPELNWFREICIEAMAEVQEALELNHIDSILDAGSHLDV
jgi:DNA-binding transcriptional LysR family regulator